MHGALGYYFATQGRFYHGHPPPRSYKANTNAIQTPTEQKTTKTNITMPTTNMPSPVM